VLGHRYVQARWGAEQAAEKTIKAVLKIAGTSYPTGAKGHDLLLLAGLLDQHHGITLNQDVLSTALCSTGVRYVQEPSTEDQALTANHAVLAILRELSTQERTANILNSGSPPG
jgi:HEPN domain-containing protein